MAPWAIDHRLCIISGCFQVTATHIENKATGLNEKVVEVEIEFADGILDSSVKCREYAINFPVKKQETFVIKACNL